MRKRFDVIDACMLIVLLAVASMVLAGILYANHESEQALTFGRFVEISRNGSTEYTVYDEETHIVYICVFYNNNMTMMPYIMRDMYGQMTVGVYDEQSGKIYPAELYEDEELWKIAG